MDSRLDPFLSNEEIDQDSHDEFESIPLPNQFPKSLPIQEKMSFDNIEFKETPSVKSRTVQTLLSQNQDLMARLTVALKRNIELEQKIESQEEIYNSLSSQYDILKNESNIHVEKSKHLEFENNKLFDQNASVEKRFGELYTAYQDKVKYIQNISYRLHRYLQYRKRIKGYVRPLISNLKIEIENLKNQILVLNEQGIKQLDFINELKKKYSDATDRIQAINNQNEKTQKDLIQYHEVRYQAISQELETLKIETESLRTQKNELKNLNETLSENEAALSNKSIFFERKYTDLKNEFEQISQEFIQQKTSDNIRLTNLEIKLKEVTSEYSKVTENNTKLQEDNQTINDQFQSLQIIYQDNLEKIETLNKKTTAQDQINRELSQSLLESRKKSEHLEKKLATAEEEFKRKLQAFQVRFNKTPNNNLPLTKQLEEQSQGQKELLNKIQSLLSEIQTGHSFQESKEDLPSAGVSPNSGIDELISEFGEIEKKT